MALTHICQTDATHHLNTVSSVYFDTDDWRLAREKAASDYLKTKLRVRWYTNTSHHESPYILELKSKIGSTRQKQRIEIGTTKVPITRLLVRDDVRSVISDLLGEHARDYSRLLLRPRLLVRYHRHRYTDWQTNSRIAVDHEVRAARVLDNGNLITPFIPLSSSVLELKGPLDELPPKLRRLNGVQLKKAAYSKYYNAFCALTHYKQ